jgi:Xaa-Pro aminopeptidase
MRSAQYQDELRKSRGLSPEVPPEELQNRLRRLRKIQESKGIDAILLYGSSWQSAIIRYLVNYVSAYRGSESFLLIPREGEPVLFVDQPWYLKHAAEMTGLRFVESLSIKGISETIKGKGLSKSTMGLLNAGMPAAYYLQLHDAMPYAHLVDCGDALDELLLQKSEYDKRVIREAAKIADEGMRTALCACGRGKREYEVGLAAERTMVDLGAEVGASTVQPYVFVGSGSTIPANIRSYNYTARKFTRGDMFFIDLSLCYKGYFADFCRTAVIGKPTTDQREVYEIVMHMHRELLRRMRPGLSGREVCRIGIEIAREHGRESNINGFGFGHGIGVQIVEPPLFDSKESRRIESGQFYTIEPGIFLPGIALSDIEDVTYLHCDGPELVTRCDRSLHVA